MLKALVTAEVIKEELRKYPAIDFEYAGYNINHEVLDRYILKEKLAGKDILICEYDTIDEEILEKANDLKLIICCRGGYQSVIDTDAVTKRGIMVCNTVGRNADAVTELVMAFVFDMTRNITKTDKLIHNHELACLYSGKPEEYKDTVWGLNNDSPFIMYRGRSVKYMTLGVVGFGHVGKRVCKVAKAFGMNVIVHDPHKDPNDFEDTKFVSFEELLKCSDIISVHCPKNNETRNMFSKENLANMKQGSYFINTARGDLVDEEALVDLLNSDYLAGAALDVTKFEPIPAKSPLLTAKNLILTPHIGGSSDDVQIEGTRIIERTLNSWLKGEIPINCVIK